MSVVHKERNYAFGKRGWDFLLNMAGYSSC